MAGSDRKGTRSRTPELLTVDELINRAVGWAHSRVGRLALTGVGFVVALAIIMIPLTRRANPHPPAPPAAIVTNQIVPSTLAPPTTLTPNTLPLDVFSSRTAPFGFSKLAPPTTASSSSTTSSAPSTTVSTTTAPPTTIGTQVPPTTAPPDTGIAVPVG